MRIILKFLICFAFPVTAVCQSSTNWSYRISSRTKYPISYWFSHSGASYTELRIDGKRFERVRGDRNFYLKIPESNKIVFVEDMSGYYSIIYHIFDMNSGEDIKIRARDSSFGNFIGSSNRLFEDKVESNKDGVIVLSELERSAKSTLPELRNLDSIKSLYYLDTSKKTVIEEKILYYDNAGNVIRELDEEPPF